MSFPDAFLICEGNILNHIYIIEKNMAIVKIHLEKYISVLFNILKGLTTNIMITLTYILFCFIYMLVTKDVVFSIKFV
jgi:hypothetical protein